MPASFRRSPVCSKPLSRATDGWALVVTVSRGDLITADRRADVINVRFSNRPSGSSTFRLSTTPVSMSLTGSRFSSLIGRLGQARPLRRDPGPRRSRAGSRQDMPPLSLARNDLGRQRLQSRAGRCRRCQATRLAPRDRQAQRRHEGLRRSASPMGSRADLLMVRTQSPPRQRLREPRRDARSPRSNSPSDASHDHRLSSQAIRALP
jgi:hypothetical protein